MTFEERLIKALLAVQFNLLIEICESHGVSRGVASAIALEYFERSDNENESDSEVDEYL